MTDSELLTRFEKLSPSQFNEVLYRAKIPVNHLPGPDASQTTRAINAIHYADQSGRRKELEWIIEQILPNEDGFALDVLEREVERLPDLFAKDRSAAR